MTELLEKMWYKPVCWKEFNIEEIRLMGRIKTGFNLDQYFSPQEESDAKTFLTSHSRNLTVNMLVDQNKIEIDVKDPLVIECIASTIKIYPTLGSITNNILFEELGENDIVSESTFEGTFKNIIDYYWITFYRQIFAMIIITEGIPFIMYVTLLLK